MIKGKKNVTCDAVIEYKGDTVIVDDGNSKIAMPLETFNKLLRKFSKENA